MNRKTKAVIILLILAILIRIPESFAHPAYGGSCVTCHAMDSAHNRSAKEMATSTRDNKTTVVNRGTDQNVDISSQIMNPVRYTLGIIGTGLVVISQFYSVRKRGLRRKKRQGMHIGSIRTWLNLHTYFGMLGLFLVLLHAGLPFQFRYTGLNAGTVSTYLMITAAASGFVGRYLYRIMDERAKRIFKYWRDVHVPLLGILFLSVVIHIIRPYQTRF